MTRSRRIPTALSLAVAVIVALGAGASPALAQCSPPSPGGPHPCINEFGSFSNPNGIAVEESTGDVYVADIGTDTVSKFTAASVPITTWGTNGQLTGIPTQSGKPAESFSFPNVYGTPAAIAIDNSTEPSDPSRGDLYVMDAGHGVIDKFSPEGSYLSQLSGFSPSIGSAEEGVLLGLGVDGSGTVHVDLSTYNDAQLLIDEFDGAAVNHLIARQEWNGGSRDGETGLPGFQRQTHGFAVSATGDDYPTYEPSCSCTLKFGQKLSPLGRVDSDEEAGDVAVAVDPATGHL
jgi:DNA-binding beta-propeller fold protein YncE